MQQILKKAASAEQLDIHFARRLHGRGL